MVVDARLEEPLAAKHKVVVQVQQKLEAVTKEEAQAEMKLKRERSQSGHELASVKNQVSQCRNIGALEGHKARRVF